MEHLWIRLIIHSELADERVDQLRLVPALNVSLPPERGSKTIGQIRLLSRNNAHCTTGEDI